MVPAKLAPLPALFDGAARRKGRSVLLADERESWSGGDAADAVANLAASLVERGLVPGARVAFLVGSSARHALVFFACARAGVVPCALHGRETVRQLARTLDWLGADTLVVDIDNEELAAQVLAGAARPQTVITLEDEPGQVSSVAFSELLDSHPLPAPADVSPDDPAVILLSSGTTGTPKGVVHLQRTVRASAAAGQAVYGDVAEEDSVYVPMAPSFAAWLNVVLPFLEMGARLCFRRSFSPEAFLADLAAQRISYALLTPTMWRIVLAAPVASYDLSALNSAFFSGEPGTPDLVAALARDLGVVDVRSALLSSEGGCAAGVVADRGTLIDRGKAASTGRVVPGAELRLVHPGDPLDAEVPAGEVGEIVLRGPSLAVGYWQDDELTRAHFCDGWWRSGDLGYVDEDGDVFVVGRTDNVINSGGIKVHAEEVEAALVQHPAVREAAVVGIPDPRFGHVVEAHIAVDGEITADEILAFCLDGDLLPRVKLPKRVVFHDALPKGPTGKLYRRGLLDGRGGS